MRFLHLADIHVDSSPHGRLDDTVEALRRAADIAHDRAADAILIAGDLVERLGRPMQPAERNALRRAVAHFADHGPVFIVAGNHDMPGDVAHLADLVGGDGAVNVTERPGTWVQRAARAAEWCDLADEVAWSRALDPERDPPTLVVHALPWPRRAWLLADPAAAPTTLTDLAARTTAALRGVLATMRDRTIAAREAYPDAVVLFVGHVSVRGAHVETGQCMIGTDVEVGWEDLADVGADYVALGHIHERQAFGDRVWYSGSPCPRNFGEPRTDHGGNLVEVRANEAPVVTPITLAPASLCTVEASFDRATESFTFVADDVYPPCDIRVRYTVTEDDAPAAARAEVACGESIRARGEARAVVFDRRVEPKRTDRSREVAEARTIAAKVTAYFDAAGIETDPVRRDRVLAKLAMLRDAEEEIAT